MHAEGIKFWFLLYFQCEIWHYQQLKTLVLSPEDSLRLLVRGHPLSPDVFLHCSVLNTLEYALLVNEQMTNMVKCDAILVSSCSNKLQLNSKLSQRYHYLPQWFNEARNNMIKRQCGKNQGWIGRDKETMGENGWCKWHLQSNWPLWDFSSCLLIKTICHYMEMLKEMKGEFQYDNMNIMVYATSAYYPIKKPFLC